MGGNVVRIGAVRNAHKFVGNLKGSDRLENLGIGGSMLLKHILGNRCGGCGLD